MIQPNDKTGFPPMLPLASCACIVYPSGGVEGIHVLGAVVSVQVCRHRDPETAEAKGQYLSVPVCQQHATLSKLCNTLKEHEPSRIWIFRKPSESYHVVRNSLLPLRVSLIPEDWDDAVIMHLANEVLAKVPMVPDAKVTVALERCVPVRRAFAAALSGLWRENKVTLGMAPRIPVLTPETLDTAEQGFYDKVWRGTTPPPFEPWS